MSEAVSDQKRVGRPRKYPFAEIAKDEFFTAPIEKNRHGSLEQMAWKCGRRYGKRFVVRAAREFGLVFVWRVA